MNKLLRTLPLFAILCISACSGKYDVADNGFDKICLIYTDIFNDPSLARKPAIEKYVLVSELIEAHVRDVDAITAFSAVANADPSQKYDLFKQAAEYSLKRDWDCEIMKNLVNRRNREKGQI